MLSPRVRTQYHVGRYARHTHARGAHANDCEEERRRHARQRPLPARSAATAHRTVNPWSGWPPLHLPLVHPNGTLKARETRNSGGSNSIRHRAGVMSVRLRVAPGAAMRSRPRAVSRAGMRPTAAQRRYLKRGLDQPDGKLPLFDAEGQAIDRKTIELLRRAWLGRTLDRATRKNPTGWSASSRRRATSSSDGSGPMPPG